MADQETVQEQNEDEALEALEADQPTPDELAGDPIVDAETAPADTQTAPEQDPDIFYLEDERAQVAIDVAVLEEAIAGARQRLSGAKVRYMANFNGAKVYEPGPDGRPVLIGRNDLGERVAEAREYVDAIKGVLADVREKGEPIFEARASRLEVAKTMPAEDRLAAAEATLGALRGPA